MEPDILMQNTEPKSLFKLNSKWAKVLNVRPVTMSLPKENAGKTLLALGIENDFLNRTAELRK